MERLLELVRKYGVLDAGTECDVYVVHHSRSGNGATRHAFKVAEDLRAAGLDVVMHCGGGSIKSQMKKADASGAEFAVIIGDEECAAGEVSLKSLRRESAQERFAAATAASRIVEKLTQSATEE